ncbi:YaaA family protein [Sulfuricurvum sp.]|uniref:YaaA family protein n=1 Tax=Sulfuricurvum sp. TaxID=2025608 RepID=UPI00356A5AB8
MVILFAPSEGKREGGLLPSFSETSFLFPELYSNRLEIIKRYETLVQTGTQEALSALFGIKDENEFIRYKKPFEAAPTMKAIERYDGVAYGYLNYLELSTQAQRYIDSHVILFSNLFGPIRADDQIPDYKLKQGSAIDTVAPEKFYKTHFSSALDEMIGDREILDIRAGFYDKFYVPKNKAATLKFLKEGKVVSHWAKAYRGIVLREAALSKVESINALLALNIEGLILKEILETKRTKEIIYEII